MDFNALDISASALHAQRIKMDAIASNLANVNTTRNPDGTPGVYRRKEAVFASVYGNVAGQNSGSSDDFINFDDDSQSSGILSGSVSANSGVSPQNGVKVMEVAEDFKSPLKRVYEPSHPDADKDGYVNLPNVNAVSEMVDMISASRAYEANVTSINATKSMISSALRI